MSNPITNARALLASRDATSKFSGYPDRKLADAMRELLAEVERMRAEEARCLDAADAATREDERRHAEFVKAAMERERLLRGERDKAIAEAERLKAEHETSVRLRLLPPHPLTYADDDTDRGRTCGGCGLPMPGGFRDAHMQWCGRRHWMPPRRTKIAGVDAEALRALADDMLSEHHLTPAYLVGERLLAVFALVDAARAERDEALRRGRLEGAEAMLTAAHEAINELDDDALCDHQLDGIAMAQRKCQLEPAAIVAALEAHDGE